MNMAYGYLNKKTKTSQPRSKSIKGRLNCMTLLVEGEDGFFTGIGANTSKSIDALNVGWHVER